MLKNSKYWPFEFTTLRGLHGFLFPPSMAAYPLFIYLVDRISWEIRVKGYPTHGFDEHDISIGTYFHCVASASDREKWPRATAPDRDDSTSITDFLLKQNVAIISQLESLIKLQGFTFKDFTPYDNYEMWIGGKTPLEIPIQGAGDRVLETFDLSIAEKLIGRTVPDYLTEEEDQESAEATREKPVLDNSVTKSLLVKLMNGYEGTSAGDWMDMPVPMVLSFLEETAELRRLISEQMEKDRQEKYGDNPGVSPSGKPSGMGSAPIPTTAVAIEADDELSDLDIHIPGG